MKCSECGAEVELAAGIRPGTVLVACEEDCGWYLALIGSARGRAVREKLHMYLRDLEEQEDGG